MLSLFLVAVCAVGAAPAQEGGADPRPPNANGQVPAFPGQTRAPVRQAEVGFDVVTVARGLEYPWGLEFLPDGRYLVTERSGRLRIVSSSGEVSPPVAGLPPVVVNRQGGLLDVVLDPAFAENGLVYWSFAEASDELGNHTAVARGRLIDGPEPRVDDVQTIYRQSPPLASPFHFGGRLVFASDGTLFVTQGERGLPAGRAQARDPASLLGKIVRINPDGSVPEDNPFVGVSGARPEIWSTGHRNIQGAALHPDTGDLWEVEHGSAGGDEINVVRKGHDYGWPTVAYGAEYFGGTIGDGITQLDGTEQPIYYWDPVIAPGGMTFYTGDLFPAWRGSLFVSGLASQSLARLTLDGERIVGEERLLTDLGERLRAVRQGPDGALYLTTDPCGNGGRCSNDDVATGRILKLVPTGP